MIRYRTHSSQFYTDHPLALPSALLLVGLVYGARAWWFSHAAEKSLKWRETKGVITRSELESRTRRRRRGILSSTYEEYRPRVEYSYEVPGPDKVGTRVYFGAHRWRRESDVADRICAQYRVGDPCKVYVDPFKLDSAVLERGQTEGVGDNMRFVWLCLGGAVASYVLFAKILAP